MRYPPDVDTVFNRRNAAVGFVTLKALSRYVEGKKRKKKLRGSRIALYAGLAVVSAGLFAALVYAWRRSSVAEAVDEAREAVKDVAESADQLAEEAAAAAAEPVPAT